MLKTIMLLVELQSWTKSWRQIDEIKQNRFFYGLFYTWYFSNFYQKPSNFGGRLGTRHQIQAFQGFSWDYIISSDPKS